MYQSIKPVKIVHQKRIFTKVIVWQCDQSLFRTVFHFGLETRNIGAFMGESLGLVVKADGS
jgi:hypothetical protein